VSLNLGHPVGPVHIVYVRRA